MGKDPAQLVGGDIRFTIEWVPPPPWFGLRRVDQHDTVCRRLGQAVKDVVDEIPARVQDDDAAFGIGLVEREVAQECGFASSCRADRVDVVSRRVVTDKLIGRPP
ncbi:hypothetical protein [Fodinicola feengrottensis]|uniref:hypothetical protein n=1 Tax=Fodinicola feengrottensis TaxID=435914 RepID=UPI002441A37B|nr:hypothetical protein [Fodinicola feengrottensis]